MRFQDSSDIVKSRKTCLGLVNREQPEGGAGDDAEVSTVCCKDALSINGQRRQLSLEESKKSACFRVFAKRNGSYRCRCIFPYRFDCA